MRFKDYRHFVNASVAEVALFLGVSGAAVRYWERGEKIPSREQMAKIYEWSLGCVTPNDFYDLPSHSLKGARPSGSLAPTGVAIASATGDLA